MTLSEITSFQIRFTSTGDATYKFKSYEVKIKSDLMSTCRIKCSSGNIAYT
jgi:hypothetical protein